LIVSIATLTIAGSAHAQNIEVRAPARGMLTATLQDATAEVRVAAAPTIIELQFGQREGGQFRGYAQTEPMAYNRPFAVRVRYDSEPPFGETSVMLTWGGGQRRVTLVKTRANPAIFESRDMRFEDPNACKGLSPRKKPPMWSSTCGNGSASTMEASCARSPKVRSAAALASAPFPTRARRRIRDRHSAAPWQRSPRASRSGSRWIPPSHRIWWGNGRLH